MVDRITKILRKLSARERKTINTIFKRVRRGQIWDLDIKKLQGLETIYRIRKGNWRIICLVEKTGDIEILALERRSDTTYNQW